MTVAHVSSRLERIDKFIKVCDSPTLDELYGNAIRNGVSLINYEIYLSRLPCLYAFRDRFRQNDEHTNLRM